MRFAALELLRDGVDVVQATGTDQKRAIISFTGDNQRARRAPRWEKWTR
jgi:hypothetical protein